MQSRPQFVFGLIAMVLAFGFAMPRASADEPGLESRDDIYMQTSFESADWEDAWTDIGHGENIGVVSDGGALQGDRHLRISVDEGDHYGGALSYYFDAETGGEPEAVYFRYALRFPPNWIAYRNGKLPGFGGTYGRAGWGGRVSHGDDGWSARMTFAEPKSGRKQGNTKVGFYTYYPDMSGTYGDSWYFSGEPIGSDQGLEAGKWHNIEIYVRMNDPNGGAGTEGSRDGILRGWVDGQQVFEKSDLRFRDVDDLKVERIWANIYYGGSWTAPQDVSVEIDNVVIAENYIGPYDDTPPRERVGPDFSEVPHFGSRDNYELHTPDRWRVVEENGDKRLYLRTSDYEAPGQNLLGEWALAEDRRLGDFEMTGAVKTAESLSNNESADYAIVFGWEDTDNYRYVLGNPTADHSSVIRVEEGEATRVARADHPLVPDQEWHDLRIRYAGSTTGRLEVALDGETVMETQLADTIEGRVGVGSINDSSYFDDLDFQSIDDGDGVEGAESVDVGDTGAGEADIGRGGGDTRVGSGDAPVPNSDAAQGDDAGDGISVTGRTQGCSCRTTGDGDAPPVGALVLVGGLVLVRRL